MWDSISNIISFVGYVFAFWMLWRGFDHVVHRASNRRSKDKVPQCNHCLEYEKQIKDLQQRTRNAEDKAREKHQMDAITEEALAIGQLNIASKTEIEEIEGIGPVKAAKILSHRPFFSWVHFSGVESSSRNAIFRWAKRRLGLPHHPQPRHQYRR